MVDGPGGGRVTTALNRALGRLPEYQRLSEAVARVRAEMAEPQPPAEVADPRESPSQVAEAALEAVLAGGAVDEALVARYAAATALLTRPVAAVRHELLLGLDGRLRPQMAALVEPNADQLLGFLAEDLQGLLGEVRSRTWPMRIR